MFNMGSSLEALYGRVEVASQKKCCHYGYNLLEICLEFKTFEEMYNFWCENVSFSISGPDQGKSVPDQRIWDVLGACSISRLNGGFSWSGRRVLVGLVCSNISGPDQHKLGPNERGSYCKFECVLT